MKKILLLCLLASIVLGSCTKKANNETGATTTTNIMSIGAGMYSVHKVPADDPKGEVMIDFEMKADGTAQIVYNAYQTSNTYNCKLVGKDDKTSDLVFESFGQCLVEPQNKKGDIIATVTKISEDKIEILWGTEKFVLEKAK